jgi:hypothetical protein
LLVSVGSNVITVVYDFVLIGELVQMLSSVTHTHTHTHTHRQPGLMSSETTKQRENQQ